MSTTDIKISLQENKTVTCDENKINLEIYKCDAQDSHINNKPIINMFILHNGHIKQPLSLLW